MALQGKTLICPRQWGEEALPDRTMSPHKWWMKTSTRILQPWMKSLAQDPSSPEAETMRWKVQGRLGNHVLPSSAHRALTGYKWRNLQCRDPAFHRLNPLINLSFGNETARLRAFWCDSTGHPQHQLGRILAKNVWPQSDQTLRSSFQCTANTGAKGSS